MQKISLFQLPILEIHSILESRDRIDRTLFCHFRLKNYPPKFNFLNWYRHAKNHVLAYFIDLFQRFNSSKTTAIWLADSISNHVLGTRFLAYID